MRNSKKMKKKNKNKNKKNKKLRNLTIKSYN